MLILAARSFIGFLQVEHLVASQQPGSAQKHDGMPYFLRKKGCKCNGYKHYCLYVHRGLLVARMTAFMSTCRTT